MDTTAQAEFDDALARVFARVERASKDGTNPHLHNKYATLGSVDEACRVALTAENFSWPQRVETRRHDHGLEVVVTTQLRRRGVLWESVLAMPVGGKATAQEIGSAITYGRRYALAAAVGVCPEDDDGNAASQAQGGKGRQDGQRGDRRQDRPAEPRGQGKPAQAAAKPQGATAEAHWSFLAAFADYKAECQAQGLTPAPWLEIAGEAIGKPWSTEKGAHGPEDWQAAAQACRQAIQRLRQGGEGEAA